MLVMAVPEGRRRFLLGWSVYREYRHGRLGAHVRTARDLQDHADGPRGAVSSPFPEGVLPPAGRATPGVRQSSPSYRPSRREALGARDHPVGPVDEQRAVPRIRRQVGVAAPMEEFCARASSTSKSFLPSTRTVARTVSPGR